MARIRSIKPEFCSSADTGSLTRSARLFFLQLLTEADDEGRTLWIPRRLCGVLYPHDEDVGSAELEAWAAECASRGMVVIYRNNGTRYLQIANWTKHQKISHPTKSRLPAASDQGSSIDSVNDPETVGRNSGDIPEVLRPDLGTGNREQGTGKGSKEPSSSAKPTTPLELKPPPAADLTVRRAERLAAVTEDAIAAYNAKLGKPNGLLASVSKIGRKTRRKEVQRMLQDASDICFDQFGDKRVTPEFWAMYFAACAEDPFMAGQGPYSGAHANWRPDFEFLTRPATVLKVFERATQEDAA